MTKLSKRSKKTKQKIEFMHPATIAVIHAGLRFQINTSSVEVTNPGSKRGHLVLFFSFKEWLDTVRDMLDASCMPKFKVSGKERYFLEKNESRIEFSEGKWCKILRAIRDGEFDLMTDKKE